MIFWICNECGRLHNHVTVGEEKLPLDDWLHEVFIGLRGSGTATGELWCSRCEKVVGVVGAKSGFFGGFSYRGEVSFRYFDTLEGAQRVFPDHDLLPPQIYTSSSAPSSEIPSETPSDDQNEGGEEG